MEFRDDVHLTELIAKFYRIGKHKYNGKIYDNVLNIFDELDIEEQKSMIRGTLGVYVSVTSPMIHEREIIDRGDVDALLGYLKRAKEQETVSPNEGKPGTPVVVSKPSANDRGYSNKTDEFKDKSVIMTMIIFGIGIILVACLHLASLSVDGDQEAMSRAKFYQNLFEVFETKP